MEFDEALALVNQVFNATCGRNVNDREVIFFRGVWEGLNYEEIAIERLGLEPGTVAKDIAFNFWRVLKDALGERVSKKNFREPLRRYRERQENSPRPMPEPPPPVETQPERNALNVNNEFEAFKRIIDTLNQQINKEIDVTTISANNYDLFIKVDRISPEHESVILDKSSACGGSGANTVCGLSRLGRKTAIVGCVKNDFEGEELIESFRYFSVDTEFLIVDNTNAYNTKTGSTIVLVERDSARRQILVDPGINNYLSEILRENNEQLLKALEVKVKKSKILHLSSFAERDEMDLQLTVLEQIRNDNIIVSLTPGAIYVEEGLDRLKRILACTNILFLYIQQLARLLERSNEIKKLSLEEKIKLFFEWRIQQQMTHPLILVIKNYSKSKADNIYKNHILVASHFDNSVSFFKPKFTEPRNRTIIPEDSTGTGDALAAGFLYGILKGEDIETCTEYGFIMSREVSLKLGARSNLPNENSLESYRQDLT